MSAIRDSLASMFRIDTIEFWAAGVSGGGTRRVAQYPGIGVEGADTDDLGEDARTDQFKATVAEDVYIKLEALRRTGKVYNVVHPLFGSIQGRLLQLNYEATEQDDLDITFTILEHGKRTAIAAPVSLSAAAQSAAGAKGLFDDALDDLADFDFSTAAASVGGFTDQWDDFAGQIDSTITGSLPLSDLAGGIKQLGESLDSMIASVDSLGDFTTLPLIDAAYQMVDAARQCVDAAQNQVSTVVEKYKAIGPISLLSLAKEYFGQDVDGVEMILSHNPELIDVNVVPAGFELMIPIV